MNLPQSTNMTIDFPRCPHCFTDLKYAEYVYDFAKDSTMKCDNCGKQFTVEKKTETYFNTYV